MEEKDIEILLNVLKKIPLFQGLNATEHKAIIENIILMFYPANYELFSEGEEGDALYIIKNGSVSIFHPITEDNALPKQVAEINDGGFFGEMALVSDELRNASAKTIMDSEIFILSKDKFKELLSTNTTLAEQVSATMVDRIEENINK